MRIVFPFIFLFSILNAQSKIKSNEFSAGNSDQLNLINQPNGEVKIYNFSKINNKIAGRFTDKGVPLAGLEVELNDESGLVRKVKTSNNGEFLFDGLVEGYYSIFIAKLTQKIGNINQERDEALANQLFFPVKLSQFETNANLAIDISKLIKFKYVHNAKSNTVAFLDGSKLFASHQKIFNCIGGSGQTIVIKDYDEIDIILNILKGKHKFELYDISTDSTSDCENYYVDNLIFSLEKEITADQIVFCKSATILSFGIKQIEIKDSTFVKFKFNSRIFGYKDNSITASLNFNDSEGENTKLHFYNNITISNNVDSFYSTYQLPLLLFEKNKLYLMDFALKDENRKIIERHREYCFYITQNREKNELKFFNIKQATGLDKLMAYIRLLAKVS